MTNRLKSWLAFALCAALAPGRGLSDVPPAAQPGNVVQAITVSDVADGVELAIRGTRAPSYTVFKLQDPARLVIDLAGADVSGIVAPVEVGKSGVRDVTAAQYRDDRSSVGRIIVGLDGAPRYEVTARGVAVVVKVSAGKTTAAQSTVALRQGQGERAPSRGEPAPAPATPDHVVSRRIDEAEVSHAATAITGASTRSGDVMLALDGEVARFEVIELSNPSRLAIDLYGVRRAPRASVPLNGSFTRARFGRDSGKVRVVLDAAGELPRCEVKRVEGGLAIAPAPRTPSASRAGVPSPLTPSVGRAAAAGGVEAPAASARRIIIEDLRFSQSGNTARVELSGDVRGTVKRPDPRTLVLTLENARLPRKLERSLDTTAFHGPVAMMSAFNDRGGDARIVLSLRREATDTVAETGGGLAWTISSTGAAPETTEAPRAVVAEAQAAAAAGEGTAYSVPGPVQRREYSGRRITLDFHDIEIRNLLRLIADVSKKNIVVADDVSGKVTVSLRNVPWDQALDLVLKSKGLGKEEMGNVIRIAKFEQIASEQKARAEAEKARTPLLPLKVRIIPVNFARAGDMAGRIKDVLTDRGTVSTDERTNVLIVKDVQEALVRAEGLVRNLDTEIPQVLIEARIIEATSNFNRTLGVQWGGHAAFSQATGNPTGLVFPNNAVAQGGILSTATTGNPANPSYAVSLPAAVGDGSGGALGLMFGSAGGAFNLNLRLSALENNGTMKTISAPKISTIDNKEATIGQGVSIPFSQVSAAGVNTMFIEAKLELKVTPHVSADGSILLKIKATNNAPNPQLTGANGQPAISKREAETEVLVKDGDTTVIGGIYTRQTTKSTSEVPFLGKIPLLGYFFRSATDTDDHSELLIFITPHIVNRQATTVAAGGAN